MIKNMLLLFLFFTSGLCVSQNKLDDFLNVIQTIRQDTSEISRKSDSCVYANSISFGKNNLLFSPAKKKRAVFKVFYFEGEAVQVNMLQNTGIEFNVFKFDSSFVLVPYFNCPPYEQNYFKYYIFLKEGFIGGLSKELYLGSDNSLSLKDLNGVSSYFELDSIFSLQKWVQCEKGQMKYYHYKVQNEGAVYSYNSIINPRTASLDTSIEEVLRFEEHDLSCVKLEESVNTFFFLKTGLKYMPTKLIPQIGDF